MSRQFWEKLIEIDDTTPLAHQTKAELLWRFDNKWTEAESEYRRAAELDSSVEPDVNFLMWMGRRAEGLALLERQVEQADPLDIGSQIGIGWGFLFFQEFDRTIELAEKILELEPDRSPDIYNMLEMSYGQTGREEEAFELSLEYRRKFQDASEEEINALRKVFDESGIAGVKKLRGVQKPGPNSWRRPIVRAAYFAGLGDKDQAFEWLEKAWQKPLWAGERTPSYYALDPLRDDPRFEELLRKQNLPEEAIQRHLALR
jgi:tetratricopeptide (TPR) repeat protein